MPVPSTVDDFLTVVRKSGVVAPPSLDGFVRGLAEKTPLPTNPQRLAKVMIRAGLLTNLQAGFLLQGKWRNFELAGKYRLLELLGVGGMGRVYLCEHTRLHRLVAIKVLPHGKAEDTVLLKRFKREAQAVANLNHPNIVKAHDFDQDGPLHFLVMEYVYGSGLDEIVRSHGPLSVERACNYIAQAAEGLQSAHEAGFIHRDVKPANLLLDSTGLVKVLDLGLARSFSDGDNLTQQYNGRNLIGTADYLAPEQATNSHGVDIRADIYSLGATFYLLLTGKPPFCKGTVNQRLISHQGKVPDLVTVHQPEVPPAVAQLVAKMLAKDPADRFQTPADVAQALEPWTRTPIPPPPAREMPKLSRAIHPSDGPFVPLTPRPEPVAPPVARQPLSNPMVVALIVACLGVAGWFGWALWDALRAASNF